MLLIFSTKVLSRVSENCLGAHAYKNSTHTNLYASANLELPEV